MKKGIPCETFLCYTKKSLSKKKLTNKYKLYFSKQNVINSVVIDQSLKKIIVVLLLVHARSSTTMSFSLFFLIADTL